MEQRVSLVTLCVSDLARARQFYTALGWTPATADTGDDVVFFQAGGLVLGLWDRAMLGARQRSDGLRWLGRRDAGL